MSKSFWNFGGSNIVNLQPSKPRRLKSSSNKPVIEPEREQELKQEGLKYLRKIHKEKAEVDTERKLQPFEMELIKYIEQLLIN